MTVFDCRHVSFRPDFRQITLPAVTVSSRFRHVSLLRSSILFQVFFFFSGVFASVLAVPPRFSYYFFFVSPHNVFSNFFTVCVCVFFFLSLVVSGRARSTRSTRSPDPSETRYHSSPSTRTTGSGGCASASFRCAIKPPSVRRALFTVRRELFTGGHSKWDQILSVKIGRYMGFRVYRRSCFTVVPRNTVHACAGSAP